MQAMAAGLHFIGLAVMAGCLVAEYCLLHPAMQALPLRALKRIDATYGLTAGAMIATGLWRIHVEKGMEYYTGNPWFWTKMGLFGLAALVSLYPTVRILRTKPEAGLAMPVRAVIRHCVHAQWALIAAIIACATIMARG